MFAAGCLFVQCTHVYTVPCMDAVFFLRPIDKALYYIIYVHLCTVLCAFIVHSISLSFGLSALISYTSQPKRAPIAIGMNTGCHVVHLIRRGMMRLDGKPRIKKALVGCLVDAHGFA